MFGFSRNTKTLKTQLIEQLGIKPPKEESESADPPK